MFIARAYIVFGLLLCGLFAYANSIGWKVIDFENLGSHKPKGAAVYHK